jgi:predicted nucleic acid-binding protein
VADVLFDTGVWFAILDEDDRDHPRCVEALRRITGRLVSSEAVLTETMWLVAGLRDGPGRCADFVRRGIVTLIPTSGDSLARAVDLMARYRNLPMDFADASLVTLGEDLGLDRVFTLDRRGFGVYRLHGRRPFQIIP